MLIAEINTLGVQNQPLDLCLESEEMTIPQETGSSNINISKTLIKKIVRRIFQTPLGLLGLAIVKIPLFNKYKLYLLSTWQDVEKRNKIDEILYRYVFYSWIKFDYLKKKDPDKRETLKSICMGGEGGKNWAEYYQTKDKIIGSGGMIELNGKVGHMTFQEACPIFDEISSILENADSNYLVIQIGSSSGGETAYFAKMFPQHEFVGSDIYDEVVEYSNGFHNYPNLSFVKCSAKEIGNILNMVDIDIKNKPVLIYSSGSLQYVQPEHLTIFFNALSMFANFKILISEPGNESKGKTNEVKTSIFRGNFSYTHDYKWYAEKSGIEMVQCEIIRPYCPYADFPMHENTVHYFYSGKKLSVIYKNSRFHPERLIFPRQINESIVPSKSFHVENNGVIQSL